MNLSYPVRSPLLALSDPTSAPYTHTSPPTYTVSTYLPTGTSTPRLRTSVEAGCPWRFTLSDNVQLTILSSIRLIDHYRRIPIPSAFALTRYAPGPARHSQGRFSEAGSELGQQLVRVSAKAKKRVGEPRAISISLEFVRRLSLSSFFFLVWYVITAAVGLSGASIAPQIKTIQIRDCRQTPN